MRRQLTEHGAMLDGHAGRRPRANTRVLDTAPRRRAVEDALVGYPASGAQIAAVLDNFARLCAAGMGPAEALGQAALGARIEFRAALEEAAARSMAGMALSDALDANACRLPPLVVPALRAWERNGQRDADLRVLARELRRLGAVQQRNIWLEIRAVMEWVQRRERLARLGPATRKARVAATSSRGGIARGSRAAMRWTDLFAALWRCNVPISEALEAAAEGCGNSYHRDLLLRAAQQTREGLPLSECFAETRLLSTDLVERIRTGEVSGRLDETLEQFARVQEGDAKELGDQVLFMRRILPLILLCSAGVILLFGAARGRPDLGLIVAAVFLPIAFGAWELIFKISVAGEPNLGIGGRRRKSSAEKETR